MPRSSTVLVQREGASNAGPFPLHSHPRSTFPLTDGSLEKVAALDGHDSLDTTRRYCDSSLHGLEGAVALNSDNGTSGVRAIHLLSEGATP